MPNPSSDHLNIPQEEFRGLYARGLSDTAPNNFFIDCLNNKYDEGDVLSRDGLILNLTKGNIVRFFVYKRLSENPRFIFLDTSGNLLDSLAPGTPIWTDATITDFSMVNYNNRAYITVHNRVKGIAGKFLLVYQGSGMARLAAGLPPSGFTLTAVNSATAGNVETGYHLFAVANITDSGFITAPGPAVFALLSVSGGFKVDIGNVAVGPAGTAERVILGTKSIPVAQFTGNQYGYEFFFIPNATIPDNVTTTIKVNFYDADLQNSADYLIDNLSQIPAGVGIGVYSGRLIVWGEDGNQFTIRGSNPLQPEVFSAIGGFITVDPSDSESGVKNCAEFRKNLTIWTSNRIYSTADNGSDLSTWNVNPVDESSGTECYGINTVLDARGTNTDRMFVATRAGLISYEGYIRRPELSFNIEDLWKRINKKYFNLVQVVDDPVNHRFLISVPLDSATTISHILHGDYSKAFTVYGTIDEKMIKWSIWSFPSAPISIMGNVDSVTGLPIIHIAVAAGNIYDMKDGLLSDYGNAIDSWFKTNLKTVLAGWVNHFGGMKLRVKGTGSLQISLFGEDDVATAILSPITISASPGSEYDRLCNFINEKCSIKFRVNQFGESYVFSQVILFAKALWLRRPA